MAITDYSILPVHDSKSQPPQLFDGTTRLYISVICPYAQRVWIARNYKGLQDIQILPIDLQDRPDWYKEKVYPPNKVTSVSTGLGFICNQGCMGCTAQMVTEVGKVYASSHIDISVYLYTNNTVLDESFGWVPALEHNGKVKGESLDLLEYLDNHFEGPKLNPTDPAKKEAADELLKYTDSFTKVGYTALSKPESEVGQEVGPALDYLENALGKFDDGPFFLGQFSLVDIAYAPFVERYEIVFPSLKNYNITAGRPKLSKWIEASDKCLFLCTLCCYR
eukprot:Gb_12085 [translate_table: standard]